MEPVRTWYADETGLQVGLEVLLAGLRDGVQRTNHNPTALSPGTLRVKIVQDVRVTTERVTIVIWKVDAVFASCSL